MNHTWFGKYEARCGKAKPGDALAEPKDANCPECLEIEARVEIPRVFFDDHAERELPTPEIVGRSLGRYVIRRDDPALPELINDAEYYAHPDGPDEAPRGLKRAAQNLLDALGRSSR